MRAWMAMVLAAGLAAAPLQPLAAQEAGDREPLFSGEDAWWAGGFLLGAAAMAPLDVRLAQEIRDSVPQANELYQLGAGAMRVLGFPGSVVATGALYAAGRIADRDEFAAAGLHAGEAIVAAVAVTYLAKGLVGRARPFLEPDDPFNVGLGRGFTRDRYQSFPSGHTTAAFAAAAALTSEIGYHEPAIKAWSGVLLFGAAGLVGVSRMYHNAHWASDVVMGAAIGTFAGWKVVRYHRTHPGNWVDETFLSRAPEPGEDGGGLPIPIVLVWSVPLR